MTTFFRRTAALILCTVLPVTAQVPGDFICAGTLLDQVAGKPTQSLPKDVRTTGRIKILVVFAKFAGDYPQETSAPEWASGLFDVNQPGSLSHFYDTMSGGQLAVEGTVAPGFYEASRPTAAYLAPTDTERGGYPAFSHEILPLVDADLNLGDFNNDGADGIANSADDDNLVDFTFIILKDVPARFLAGPATGIFGLGRYYRDFVSADSTGTRSLGAIASRFLRIPTERISVMQGASLPEAAGILSHEFAHLLGVPDLFNVDFVYREGRQPVDDSAGIGAWGLMGWGALGWSGNDGPNSFSAWTLLELGWVDIVRPTSKNDVMRLAPIMEGRAVYEILLPNNRERFLVANRSRADNYYDRHIPGEGLLIWHEETDAALNGADLECADGKWVSAGFPLGSIQDESDGGDNLDFWAHDAQYRQTHAGNIGDATDPFDGVNYRRFSPETNPGSRSSSGEWSFLVEDIEFDADRIATAIVHPVPLVEVTLKITDDSGDGLVLAGEGAALGFNLSVLERFSGDLRAVFVSSDSLVEIERPEFIFQTDFGGSSTIKTFDTARRTPLETLPRFRVPGSVEAVREVPIQMLIYRGTGSLGTLLWQEDFSVEVISAQRPHLSQVSFVEVAGNGDGKAQAGEIVSLSVDLELLKADILRALTVQVGVVDTEVRRLSPSVLTFGALSEGKAHSSHSPDFLLPLDLRTDTELQFAVSFSTGFENWSDTISVAVTAGVDETPPRVGDAFVSTTPQGLSMVLLQSRILDASQIASATGLVRGLPNNELLASIELTRYDDRFAGAWATDAAGPVAVTVVVGDRPGNEGLSPAEQVAMAQSRVGPFPIGVDEVGVGAPITGLAFNLSGSLVSVASGTSLKLYDPLTLRLLQTFPLASKATAVANDPWNELLAAGAADGTVALWDLNGMREVGRFGEGEPSAVRALAFGTNPRLLAIGYQDGRVDLWDIRRGLPSYSQTLRPAQQSSITTLAFQPGEDRLAIGQENGQIVLWRIDRRVQQVLEAHDGPVLSVVFSDGRARMASGGGDQKIKLWEQQSAGFTLEKVYEDHDDAVEAVAFSRDSQILAAAGLDGKITLRQPNELKQVQVATQAGGLTALAFSPDGVQLVSGNWQGALQFRQVSGIETRRPLDAQPQDALLLPAYPNPFNAGTVLPFRLLRQADVTIEIFDIVGQKVRVLDGGGRAAGLYSTPSEALRWDGRNQHGQIAAAGVYLAVLRAGNTTQQQKLLLLK